jgi:3-oxoacyl-[acyl-carrier-protein] synthase III
MSCVSYYDYYKPSQSLSAWEVLTQAGLPPQQREYLINQGNLSEIAVETELDPHEMLGRLIEKYQQTHRVADIHFLIFTGVDQLMNSQISVPYYLVTKYGMRNATVLALNQGCAGTLHAIHLADNLVRNHPGTKVMIAAVNKIATVRERLLYPTIGGDGAGILVVARDGRFRILDSMAQSDGTSSYECYIHAGQTVQVDYLQREKMIMVNLNRLLNGIVGRNGLTVGEIKLYIPQSVNRLIYKAHAQKLRVAPDKFFLGNIPDGGHLGDVDSIRNFKDGVLSCLMQQGEKVVLFSLGEVGDNFNYVANLLEVVCC